MEGTDLGALLNILLGAGVPLRVGLMIATAIFLGYFAYDQTNTKSTIVKVFIVCAIFLAFEIWITISIFNNIDHPILLPPVVTLLILGGLFLLGFASGMYMAQRLDKIRTTSHEREKRMIEEIKQNGKT